MCNSDDIEWAKAARLNSIIDTPRIAIAPYNIMMLATMDESTPNHATELLSYIGTNHGR